MSADLERRLEVLHGGRRRRRRRDELLGLALFVAFVLSIAGLGVLVAIAVATSVHW
jgi:hypothetical protein